MHTPRWMMRARRGGTTPQENFQNQVERPKEREKIVPVNCGVFSLVLGKSLAIACFGLSKKFAWADFLFMTFQFPGRIRRGRCEENFLALFFERRSLTLPRAKFKLVSRRQEKKTKCQKGFHLGERRRSRGAVAREDGGRGAGARCRRR